MYALSSVPSMKCSAGAVQRCARSRMPTRPARSTPERARYRPCWIRTFGSSMRRTMKASKTNPAVKNARCFHALDSPWLATNADNLACCYSIESFENLRNERAQFLYSIRSRDRDDNCNARRLKVLLELQVLADREEGFEVLV